MTVTALSAGNSLVNPTKADIFASEESILHALAFVRHSAIPTPKKNSLRDLFLAYAGTADPKEQEDVKSKIIKELQGLPGLSSLLPKEKPATSGTVGMSRPVPSFVASTILVPEVVPPASVSEISTKPVAEPIPEIKPEPIPPAPLPPPAPGPAVASVPPPQTANAKGRIDAIKRDINGRVGNPVNLIETNETVGREYMTALLDAMKRTSRGDGDLSRLEAAYQAALAVISKNTIAAEAPVEKSMAPEVPPVPVTPPVEIPPQPEVMIPPAPAPLPKHDDGPRMGLYHRPIDEVIAEEVRKPVEVVETPRVVPPSIPQHELKMPEEVKLPARPPQPSVAKIKVASVEELKPVPPPEVKVEPAPKPAPVEAKPVPAPKPVTPPKVASVADTKLRPLNETSSALPEQISKLKIAAAAVEEATKKPITDLKAPEIDQGLRLLLAEWVLFKHSGFLRKKPSGIDSPLYKQLAPLPMASVIAGRFEGVTPEIKHTLADYMTGWRYEQGIVHDMGETFENYLRRVVKEILEKQRVAKTVSAAATQKNDKMAG